MDAELQRQNETRQYQCLRKYDKIVNQFDQLMDVMDAMTQLPKRRKTSNRQARKKSSSGAGSIHSVPAADEATSNAQVAGQGDSFKVDKTSVLEQIITKHLNDLQSDHPPESSSPSRDP